MKSKELNFEYIEEFADYIVETVERDEDLFLTVVGKFEEIKELIREIFTIAEVNFDSIQIESPLIDGYCDEFVLSLWMNDGVLEVGCEKLKDENGYTNPCGDETYIIDNVSSKILSLCGDSDQYYVHIDEEYDCDEDCDCDCCCSCHKDEEDTDNNISIKLKRDLDADEVFEIVNKIEKRMFEVNKIFNEMNDMRNLFRF